MVDLHRHSQWSSYDGSGKNLELAQIAKEKGYTSLSQTDHGTTSGLVQHYDACKKVGIKPILGCEGYFLPKYKEQTRGFHLILLCKNLEGYKNLNILQSEGDKIRYYNPIWTFEMLEKYHEGLICSSACVASFSSKMILADKTDLAIKYLQKMKKIFKDDFYLEIQPYSVSEKGVQEKINVQLLKLSTKLDMKCILTSDSHRGRKEDLEEYITMHRLRKNDEEYLQHIRETYKDRYMPDLGEMEQRFVDMHKKDFCNASKLADEMIDNVEEIELKVENDILDQLASRQSLPQFDSKQDSFQLLKKNVIQGLKDKKLFKDKKYVDRAKQELEVVKQNNFADYFLVVQDYVMWAKKNNIGVGPGRGSGCNCLLNYLLGITDVDSVYFDLDFKRFIRENKKSLPDIDIDFEPERRAEVQNYILDKYKGQSCQIASYGIYKVDNLLNDLIKLYPQLSEDVIIVKQIKQIVHSYKDEEEGSVNLEKLMQDRNVQELNKKYKRLFDTFCFLHNQVKYIGTHAAGIAVSKDSIYYYTALRYDKKSGKVFSCYNLVDLERCGIIKYDILGLATLTSIYEIRKRHNVKKVNYKEITKDPKVLEAFNQGITNGVFQFSEDGVQKLLQKVDANSFADVVATTAMNRPGPMTAGVPDQYVEAKQEWKYKKDKPPYASIIDSTYGCILYQEQIMGIANKYGGLTLDEADMLRKMDEPNKAKSRMLLEKYRDEFTHKMITNMKKYGMSKQQVLELFESFICYSFNKGHATGYTLISFEEMYNKVHYPNEFWFTKLNQRKSLDQDAFRFMSEASHEGALFFLPHVNYTSKFSLRKIDGEVVIQIGLESIKGVGSKAAQFIQQERKKNGIFISYDDFISRCKIKGSPVNKRVIDKLIEEGALNFNKKQYINEVKKFNVSLYSRVEKKIKYSEE